MTLLVILTFAILMFFGAPLFTILGGIALFLLYSSHIDSSAMIIEMHRIATTPILVAIPLFTLAGYLLSEGGAPKRLIRLTDAFLGWLPGGLSIIVLITCASFTALTGATGFTIIAMGGILFPALIRGKISGTLFPWTDHHLGDAGSPLPAQSSPDHLRHRREGQD